MKNMKMFIWDFDGTLLDTYPNLTKYLHQALLDFGYDVPQTEILEKMMVTIPHAINYYSEKFQVPDLGKRYKEYNEQEAQVFVPTFPKVKRVLQRIREIGADNYIFTHRGNTIYSMLKRVGILEEFREIITAEDDKFVAKPAPDSLLYLMDKYGGIPETTVMIGDRCCDLESGYNAKCRTCHLLTPAVPQYPICDWRINNFEEMLELLK